VPAPSSTPTRSAWPTRDGIAGLGVAAALVALVFLTSSSLDQTVTASNTWSEIAVMLLGAGACVAVVLIGAPGRAWGGVTIGLFAAFAALAALSIVWSVQPDWSWFGANQLLCYLTAFAGAVALGRLAPQRWPALVGAIATAMAALSAYSLLAKVFPATLAPANFYGRLLAPFGYWNAIGVSAALGLPPCLWAATRRHGGVVLRALTVPAMTLMISVVVLSYSRSAALVAALGVAAWLGFVPLRLRSALTLALAGVGAVPIVIWALGSHALISDHIALSAQDAAGHSFGLVVVVVLVVMTAAGFAASLMTDRVAVPAVARRRIGTVLVVGAALIPVAGVAAVAASSRGLFGEISHAWHSLTSTNSVVGDNSSRITQLGSSRPLYWHEGISVGGHAPLKGVGELGYGIARLQYTTSSAKTDQAHSYLVQTFADLGIVGLVLTLALLVAWGRAAARPLSPRARWQSLTPAQVAERQGLVALAVIVVVFGVQSALDFTFFFPGVTIPALLCAGWLAGRGPLLSPVGWRREPRAIWDRPGAGLLVTLLLAAVLAGAWIVWQPLRSANALSTAEAATSNPVAFAAADSAAGSDPLSIEPLLELSSLYQGVKDNSAARAELVKATQRQPDNPEPWVWLGTFDLQTGELGEAISVMGHVLRLDHVTDTNTTEARSVISQAVAALAARQRAAPPVARRARARHPAPRRAGDRVGATRTQP
jgi:cytochrome c-type biogenesis protein CcmH/NrfG